MVHNIGSMFITFAIHIILSYTRQLLFITEEMGFAFHNTVHTFMNNQPYEWGGDKRKKILFLQWELIHNFFFCYIFFVNGNLYGYKHCKTKPNQSKPIMVTDNC